MVHVTFFKGALQQGFASFWTKRQKMVDKAPLLKQEENVNKSAYEEKNINAYLKGLSK